MNARRNYSKFALLLLISALTLLSFSLVSAQGDAPACEGDYLESVRAVGTAYISALNAEDLDPWYALLTDDYQRYGDGGGFLPPLDKAGGLADAQGIMSVFPGFQTEIHDSYVSSDCHYVTFRWTSSGTHGGPLGDIPPTGISGAVSGISVTEVVDGMIATEWIAYDQLNLLGQLGLVTVGAPAPAEETPAAEETDSAAAHTETLNRVAAEGLTQGNAAILEEFIADDYVVHSPFGDLNRDAVKGLFDALRAAMTDFNVGRETMIVEGDMAGMRTILTGTFDNEFNGSFGVFPPTGQPFHVEIINLFHFNEAGIIQEEWAQFDTASFMGQLGAMPAPAAEGVMTEEEAAHFVETFDAFFVGPNPDLLDEIFAPEFVSHLPLAPDLDLEAFKGYVTSFYAGVSDMTQVTNQVIIGADRLVIHVTYYGTHDGTLFGVPATGNPITMNGIGIFEFNEDGLAVENWAVLDMAGVLAQIGALPS